MEKLFWKNALVLSLLTVSLAGVVGCQDGKKPGAGLSDAPPGTDTDTASRVVASMGSITLGEKQVMNYLQSLDAAIVGKALNTSGGLEELVTGAALRLNVIAKAAGQDWQERADVKIKIEEAQRNVLYSMYVNEKSAPPADFPNDETVANVYESTQKQQAAAGKPALKPLPEISDILKQRLRAKQQQDNEQSYLAGLVSSNPISVDMNKLVGFINLSQDQRQQQGAEPLKEPVARMGNLSVSLGLALKSLGSLELSQQRQLLSNVQQLQQYLQRLTIQYFVLNEAIAAKFNARPDVNNHMEQARLRVLYATYLNHWSAPESDFPSAALVEENYRNNQQKLVVNDRYHLAMIFIANSGDAASDGSKARQVADSALSGGADFATLARQYSQDAQSAKNGGDIGWINADSLLPEVRELIGANQAGAIVGPLQKQEGWQILKVLEHQPARQQSLDEARPALVEALRTKRLAEKEKQIIEQLVASEPVTIDKAALQRVREQIAG